MFEANLKIIEQHNQEYEDGKHTWTMGVNHLADLTHKEFMVRNQLKVPELPERKTKYTIRSQLRPFSIDWRERVIIIVPLCIKLLIANPHLVRVCLFKVV